MSAMEAPGKVVPFESAGELREAHISLMELLDRLIGQDTSPDNEAAVLSQIEPQILEFTERGVMTGVYIEEIKERTACQILLDYWVSSLSHTGRQVAAVRLRSFDGEQLPDLKDKPCPYAGLEAIQDRTFFFGREAATQLLLEQVRDTPLVVVLGASGSGKSSLVIGGVLPALREKGASADLHIVSPFVPGNSVLNHLADAVMGVCTGSYGSIADEAEKLRQDPLHLFSMTGGTGARPSLITIDQFEEVFTLSEAADREALVANLAQFLAAGRGHRVILTMREEFRSRMAELHALSSYIDNAWFSIMAMDYEELKAAVERPAVLVNLQFQSGIVDDLAKKILGQPAALPLLQFTLRSLWEKRNRNRITWEVYRKVGDPLNALENSAEQFFNGLAQQTQDEVKRILLELVRVNELLEAYRQPIPKNRLLVAGKANTEDVLKQLAENDYLRITSGTTKPDALVEIKHESLLRNWPRFVTWIDEKRHLRRQRLAITQAAHRWSESGKPQEGLLTGWQAQAAKDQLDLSELEKEFVQSSIAAVDRMQQEKEAALVREAKQAGARRFLRVAGLVSFIFMVVFLVLFFLTKKERDRVEGLVNFLIGEKFLGEVRDTGRNIMLEEVEKNVGNKLRTELNRGLALRNSGDIERMHGLLKNSVELFKQALKSIESSPDTPVRWREAARTHERLGEALAEQGQVVQALTQFEAAIHAWRQVVTDTSTVTTDDCTSLADSLVSAGDLKNRTGETNLARKDLKEVITITADILIGRQTSRKGCGPATGKANPYLDAKALEVFSHAIMLRTNLFSFPEDYDGAEALAKEARKLKPHSVSARKNALTAFVLQGNGQIYDQPQHALDEYRAALRGFESLRQRDPDNRQWRRERAANQLLVGEGLIACYKNKKCIPVPSLEDAEATILEATAALRALDQDDPSNVSIQSDIGWALQDQATVLAAKGLKNERLEKIEEAEQAYLKAQPDKADAHGISTRGFLLVEKADALAKLGRLPEARETVRKSVDLFKGLIAIHQDNQTFMAGLLEARKREAEIQRMSGDKSGADAIERELLKLHKQNDKSALILIREADELNAAHNTHLNDGARLFNQSSYTAALREFNSAESSIREYMLLRPTDFSGYNQLRIIYDWLQSTHEMLGSNTKERAAALSASMQAAQIAVLLAPEDSKRIMNANLLEARHSLGKVLYDDKRFEEALAMVQEEVAVAEELVQADLQNTSYLWRLGNAKGGLGMVRRELKKSGWEEAIRSGLIHMQKAAEIDPKISNYQKELGGWQKYLAEELEADGRREKAATEYRLAIKSYKKALFLSPKNAGVDKEIRELAKRGYL